MGRAEKGDRGNLENRPGLTVDAELIIDTVPDGLMVLDRGCRIRRWNRAMESLTGYPEREIIGKSCSILDFRHSKTGENLDVEKQCFLSGEGEDPGRRELECTLLDKQGETVPVSKVTRVIRGANGRSVGLLEILTDLRPLRKLEQEIQALRKTDQESGPGRLIGNSRGMREVYQRIRLAGDSDVNVLIEGETGTGKELIAEAIHEASHRSRKPLVRVNCSALSENLLESELFGHVRGAFTGAVNDKTGRIEAAEGGTLFLDEIGDISPMIQLKLLRVLQEHEYERVGEAVTRRADIRIIAATHRNLRQRIAEGTFREDFFYRIHVFSISVPPLRERKVDIPPIYQSFVHRMNQRTLKQIDCLLPEARKAIMDYCWPGNVRELENAIEHAFVTCPDHCIRLEDLPFEIRNSSISAAECGAKPGERDTYKNQAGPLTRERVLSTLQACNWNRSEAARRLGIDRTTVWRRLKQWNIDTPKDS